MLPFGAVLPPSGPEARFPEKRQLVALTVPPALKRAPPFVLRPFAKLRLRIVKETLVAT
jgi:hypothetical protein